MNLPPDMVDAAESLARAALPFEVQADDAAHTAARNVARITSATLADRPGIRQRADAYRVNGQALIAAAEILDRRRRPEGPHMTITFPGITPGDAADAGASWLDTVEPRWFTEINPIRLDMGFGFSCVLGQVYSRKAAATARWAFAQGLPDGWDGWAWVNHHPDSPLRHHIPHIPGRWSPYDLAVLTWLAAHGFWPADGTADAADALTETWLEQVAKRMEAR